MRPGIALGATGLIGVAQIGAAAAVSALIGNYLQGSFPLDDSGAHEASCALSMKSQSACSAGYVSTTVSCLLSLLLIAMQCAVTEGGRPGLGFCGPILSFVGFFWWVAYAAAATSAAAGAQRWEDGLSTYRNAVVGVSWAAAALFLISFFVSAAAAAAAARARSKLADPSSLHRAGSSKRFNQPLPSPPVSPIKSQKTPFYDPFDSQDSPKIKKWVQPLNPRAQHMPVTSDGRHTLVLVDGEPVPLSPSLSPLHSPTAAQLRSPLQSPLHAGRTALQSPTASDRRLLATLSGSGSGFGGVGGFSTVLLPHGSEEL